MDTGLLSEHEPIPQDDQTPETYQPTPEATRAIKLVDKVFKKSKKWRANYDRNWLTDYKFFRGQQWSQQRPSYRHSEVINMVFQAIQSSVPMLTDSRPKFEFLPQDPTDMDFAKIMNQVAENDWQRNNWSYKLTEIIYDAHFYGTGFGCMKYDPKAKKGMGDIVFHSEDPFYCFPDPNSEDVNTKSRSFVVAEPVDVEVIREDYPENGQFVTADLDDLSGGDKTDVDNYYKYRLANDLTKQATESAGNVDAHIEKKCLKKTAYIFSDEIQEDEIKKEDGTSTFQQTKKYPNGRKIITASGILLEDGPMDYDDGKIPYGRLTNYVLPREFYGVSDIEQLKGPQVIFNKLVSFAMDVLTLMGNPIWVVDTNSDIDTDNLINKPGLVVEKNPGTEVRREAGVQLQPYVLELIDRLRNWFDDLSGRTEVSRGATPSGVTAASAISALQDAAQTRIRLKARNIDAFLQDVGQMWISRTLQFRDVPTIIRITGDQNATQYFQFHVEHVKDAAGSPMFDPKGAPVRQAIVRQHVNGAFGDARQIPIKGELDVSVSTGSTLPFIKAQKAQDANDLFDRGAIDQEELLKAREWPNWQGVMARMQQAAQVKAEQEAAAAQAQAAAKAGMSAAPPPLPAAPIAV